ncbi:MAG TPA: patatin-like phospholipase family protein [Burkholderiales bacterium]|nr:patatin-like phospholipase family protein [Burkholderiales bacterium]
MGESSRPKVGLIMTGGGARAAYQVGVLRALSELLPREIHTPFSIICGTSAGAINAAVMAVDASNFRRGVRRLMTVWKNFHVHHVYRADPRSALWNSLRWMLMLLRGGSVDGGPVSFLDNSPLRDLLARYLDFSALQRAIDCGDLAAFSITCSGYTSGESVTFYQGRPDLQPWQRARRIGIPMPITIDHLLASAALPFIFPPVHINREYFGDGSMRQIAPVSPALHLGADRVFVIGVGRQLQPQRADRISVGIHPSLAQIAGHALNSIFLDSLEVDLERLQRINRTLEMIPRELLEKSNYPLHRVDFRVITPSEELEKIAVAHRGELPRTIRTLLYTVGAMRRSGANLLSYLLFERSYCRALIQLGYNDTMSRKDDLVAFLGWT